MSKCKARRVNDEMHCSACGLTWDVKDLDVPKCNEKSLRKFICTSCFTLFYANQGHKCDQCKVPE